MTGRRIESRGRSRRDRLAEPTSRPVARAPASPWRLPRIPGATGNRVVRRLLAARIQRMSEKDRLDYFTNAMALLVKHEPAVNAYAAKIEKYYETGALTAAIEGGRVLDEIKTLTPFLSNMSGGNFKKMAGKAVDPVRALAAARLFNTGFNHDNNAGRYVVIKNGGVDAAKADAARFFGHPLANPITFSASHSKRKESRNGTLWADGGVVVRTISSYNFYPTVELRLGGLTVEFKYKNS